MTILDEPPPRPHAPRYVLWRPCGPMLCCRCHYGQRVPLTLNEMARAKQDKPPVTLNSILWAQR